MFDKKSTRRFLSIMMVVAACGVVSTARAGEFGNQFTMLGQGEFAVGAEAGWTNELQQRGSYIAVTQSYQGRTYKGNAQAKDMKITDDISCMATLTYGVLDQLNLYAKLGVVDGGKLDITALSYLGEFTLEAELHSAFTWVLGAKARIFETDGGLGMLFSAQYSRYDDREVDSWKASIGPSGASGTDDTFTFWQINASAAIYQKLGGFTPYLGALYSYTETEWDGHWSYPNGLQEHLEMTNDNEHKVGALAGLNWDAGEHLAVNLQGVFITSTQVSLGLSYAF